MSAAFAIRLQFGWKTFIKIVEKNTASIVSGTGLAKAYKLGKARLGGLLCKADGRLNYITRSHAKDAEHGVLHHIKESNFTGRFIFRV